MLSSMTKMKTNKQDSMTKMKTNKQELESAIAALSGYGFSKVLIKRTLKDILWVYNGNDGWPLIKENGYEVVIERLISDAGLHRCKDFICQSSRITRPKFLPKDGIKYTSDNNFAEHIKAGGSYKASLALWKNLHEEKSVYTFVGYLRQE